MESFSEWLARKGNLRADNTLKGPGYFGSLSGPGGTAMTEYSIGVTGPEYDWKETEIPLLVPTLTEEERRYLQSGGEPTPEIERKARAFAEQRRGAGKSPFAQAGEQQLPPGEPRKPPSFSDWLAQKVGKRPVAGFPEGVTTQVAAPPVKRPPWGSLARGPRVPGVPQAPVSPKTLIAGLGAPGEAMPEAEQYKLLPPEEQAAWSKWHKEVLGPGELIPEIKTLPPSAQRAFERRQKTLEHYLKTGKLLIPKAGKLGILPPKLDIWKQTEKGGVDYMPTIAEKISDKIATGQDLSKIESLGNRALMLTSGIVNGYTAGLLGDAFKDQMIPQDVVDELLYQGGHFAGWIKGWPALVGKIFHGEITKPAIDALSKVVKAAPKTRAWLQYMGGATRLGAMSAAADINQPPEEVAKAGVVGTALGAIFHGTALLDFFKSPVINQMVRNVSSRTLANMIGAYHPTVITALKEDPAQALPAIVDELFMSWFSAPGKKPGLMMKQWHQAQMEIAKYNQEYKTQIKTSPEIARIVRNLNTMEGLAFRPGTEKAQDALGQENETLVQMYRDHHALVPVTAGRAFAAGPGGVIVPPETPESELRMRQRLADLREQRRQAEGLAQRTAEFEKERQAILPVPVPKEPVPEVPEPGFYMGPRGEVPAEIALEPETKRMKRELITERQLEAKRQREIERRKPLPAKAPEVLPPEVSVTKKETWEFPRTEEKYKEYQKILSDRIKQGVPIEEIAKTGEEMFLPSEYINKIPELKSYWAERKGREEVAATGRMFGYPKAPEPRVYKVTPMAKPTATPEPVKPKVLPPVPKPIPLKEPIKKVLPKPFEIYESQKVRVAAERRIVDEAIKSGKVKNEVLKPWTEEAEKSEFAQNLQRHLDFKDKQFRAIIEIMEPREKEKIAKKREVGLSLQYITPKSIEDLELDRALAERRIPGTNIRIPPLPTKPDPPTDYLLRSEGTLALEKEKHWRPGYTVVGNLRRMGSIGKKIADASDKFVFEQNADTSRDQWIAKGAIKMLGHSMKQTGELQGINLFKRSEVIGKRLVDLVEGKVQPANEHETAAKEITKQLFKDIADTSQILGMKITTAFGREVPWAERANYFPQVWKKAGLDKFLDSEDTPFRHLRSIYIEHLAKELNPDLFKSDSKEAVRQMEQRWKEIRRDMKTKPFANLEMSRILDEEVLGKIQAKWAEIYPNEKFPLERDTGVHVLMNYLAGARTRLAWVKNFGKDVLVKGSFRPELVDKLVPQMQSETNYKYTMNFFQQYLTRSGFDTRMTRLMRTTRTAQLWKLGTAFIPNSLQWFTNVLPLVSTKAGIQGLIDATKVIAGNKELKEFFMKSGARTLKSAMREAMMEDQSKINGLADAMLKVHLFNGTEYFNTLEAAMTGRRHGIEVSEKLAKQPKAYRHKAWEAELKKLGLGPEDIAQIKGGKPLGKEGSEQIYRAMFEMRKNTQFLSDAFHLPKLWSHPVGRLATQFKNFAYNQTRLILTEPLAEAWKFAKTGGREGDLAKLVKALIILPAAGAAITKAKKETYKVFGLHFYEDLLAGKSWPVKYLVFMMNTGGLGIATDAIAALGFGTKSISAMLGGPTFSDITGILEATGNTGKEVWTAITNKNPGWLSHRGTAIKEYWLRVGERLAPDMRILIQNFFKDWKEAKSATNWSAVYKEATKTYKENYKLKGEYEANQFWDAWMATQGAEYAEIFGRTPRKPTAKEIDEWWEEMGKPTAERMKMPGISEEPGEGRTGGIYIW